MRSDDEVAKSEHYRSSSVYWRLAFTEARKATTGLHEEINRLKRRMEALEEKLLIQKQEPVIHSQVRFHSHHINVF